MTITVSAYLPERPPGPGKLAQVPLEVESRGKSELVLPEVTIRDERPVQLLDPGDDGDIIVEPCAGGGPLSQPDQDWSARVFGLTNTAYHAQRAMRTVAELLGHPLPRLLVRIGMHESPRRWGGGHYRVAARNYDPPETFDAKTTGEVHIGGGSGLVPGPDGASYFAAPSHNLAIIYHEIGHHVCRHTADFRLNRLRPPTEQTNKKLAVDEGTCDMFTAIMIDSPDIYGWHRAAIPEWDRRRRMLSPQWTMASFQGGRGDPHADGTIWASACWSVRERVIAAGYEPQRFDRMLLRGLEHSWASSIAATMSGMEDDEQFRQALRERRHLATLMGSLIAVDPELAEIVLTAMAPHGIRPGISNVRLRDEAVAERTHTTPAAGS
ncbi:MAG TPA: hypothetical protein VFE65_26715 [Pseudonocardia sp.]|nr:hypothetical protein [Pseudonocardia sp.]